MKIQNPNLRGEELDLVLDYDAALAHFFKMRGLSKDGQEAFNAVVGTYPNTLYGIKEAFSLLDQEHDTKVPRYLSEKPVSVQARVILLNIEPVPHEGNLRRAAVVLRVSAVWIEIMKRLKVATVSDTFAGRLKETLGDVPMSYLADGNTCLNIIGDLLGWSKAWMAPVGAIIPGGDRDDEPGNPPTIEQARKKHEYEEAVREAARLVVEGKYRDPMEVRMKKRLAAAKKAVMEA